MVHFKIPAFIEMFKCGNVLERFYDDHHFHVNKGKKCNKYIWNSDKDHLRRTNVLYHPNIILDKIL